MIFTFENRDSLEQLREIPSESVRLVLTDPPYLIAHIGPGGGAYKHFDTEESFTMEQLEEYVKEWYRVLVPGGTVVCWFDLFKFGVLKEMAVNAGFGTRFRTVTWVKDGGNQVEVKVTYVGWVESALVFTKGPMKEVVFNNKVDGKAVPHNGLFHERLPRGKERFHPTQKSVELFRKLVMLHSNPGDTVLDSFAGSGVTALVCKELGRGFVGAERDREYFEKALVRLQ